MPIPYIIAGTAVPLRVSVRNTSFNACEKMSTDLWYNTRSLQLYSKRSLTERRRCGDFQGFMQRLDS